MRDCGGFFLNLVIALPGGGFFLSRGIGFGSGLNHACGVIYDGGVYCWGDNSGGQNDIPADLNPSIGVAAGTRNIMLVSILVDNSGWGWQCYHHHREWF